MVSVSDASHGSRMKRASEGLFLLNQWSRQPLSPQSFQSTMSLSLLYNDVSGLQMRTAQASLGLTSFLIDNIEVIENSVVGVAAGTFASAPANVVERRPPRSQAAKNGIWFTIRNQSFEHAVELHLVASPGFICMPSSAVLRPATRTAGGGAPESEGHDDDFDAGTQDRVPARGGGAGLLGDHHEATIRVVPASSLAIQETSCMSSITAGALYWAAERNLISTKAVPGTVSIVAAHDLSVKSVAVCALPVSPLSVRCTAALACDTVEPNVEQTKIVEIENLSPAPYIVGIRVYELETHADATLRHPFSISLEKSALYEVDTGIVRKLVRGSLRGARAGQSQVPVHVLGDSSIIVIVQPRSVLSVGVSCFVTDENVSEVLQSVTGGVGEARTVADGARLSASLTAAAVFEVRANSVPVKLPFAMWSPDTIGMDVIANIPVSSTCHVIQVEGVPAVIDFGNFLTGVEVSSSFTLTNRGSVTLVPAFRRRDEQHALRVTGPLTLGVGVSAVYQVCIKGTTPGVLSSMLLTSICGRTCSSVVRGFCGMLKLVIQDPIPSAAGVAHLAIRASSLGETRVHTLTVRNEGLFAAVLSGVVIVNDKPVTGIKAFCVVQDSDGPEATAGTESFSGLSSTRHSNALPTDEEHWGTVRNVLTGYVRRVENARTERRARPAQVRGLHGKRCIRLPAFFVCMKPSRNINFPAEYVNNIGAVVVSGCLEIESGTNSMSQFLRSAFGAPSAVTGVELQRVGVPDDVPIVLGPGETRTFVISFSARTRLPVTSCVSFSFSVFRDHMAACERFGVGGNHFSGPEGFGVRVDPIVAPMIITSGSRRGSFVSLSRASSCSSMESIGDTDAGWLVSTMAQVLVSAAMDLQLRVSPVVHDFGSCCASGPNVCAAALSQGDTNHLGVFLGRKVFTYTVHSLESARVVLRSDSSAFLFADGSRVVQFVAGPGETVGVEVVFVAENARARYTGCISASVGSSEDLVVRVAGYGATGSECQLVPIPRALIRCVVSPAVATNSGLAGLAFDTVWPLIDALGGVIDGLALTDVEVTSLLSTASTRWRSSRTVGVSGIRAALERELGAVSEQEMWLLLGPRICALLSGLVGAILVLRRDVVLKEMQFLYGAISSEGVPLFSEVATMDALMSMITLCCVLVDTLCDEAAEADSNGLVRSVRSSLSGVGGSHAALHAVAHLRGSAAPLNFGGVEAGTESSCYVLIRNCGSLASYVTASAPFSGLKFQERPSVARALQGLIANGTGNASQGAAADSSIAWEHAHRLTEVSWVVQPFSFTVVEVTAYVGDKNPPLHRLVAGNRFLSVEKAHALFQCSTLAGTGHGDPRFLSTYRLPWAIDIGASELEVEDQARVPCRAINFGVVSINDSPRVGLVVRNTGTVPLKFAALVDDAYQLEFGDEDVASHTLSASPTSGVVPAKGAMVVSICFVPGSLKKLNSLIMISDVVQEKKVLIEVTCSVRVQSLEPQLAGTAIWNASGCVLGSVTGPTGKAIPDGRGVEDGTSRRRALVCRDSMYGTVPSAVTHASVLELPLGVLDPVSPWSEVREIAVRNVMSLFITLKFHVSNVSISSVSAPTVCSPISAAIAAENRLGFGDDGQGHQAQLGGSSKHMTQALSVRAANEWNAVSWYTMKDPAFADQAAQSPVIRDGGGETTVLRVVMCEASEARIRRERDDDDAMFDAKKGEEEKVVIGPRGEAIIAVSLNVKYLVAQGLHGRAVRVSVVLHADDGELSTIVVTAVIKQQLNLLCLRSPSGTEQYRSGIPMCLGASVVAASHTPVDAYGGGESMEANLLRPELVDWDGIRGRFFVGDRCGSGLRMYSAHDLHLDEGRVLDITSLAHIDVSHSLTLWDLGIVLARVPITLERVILCYNVGNVIGEISITVTEYQFTPDPYSSRRQLDIADRWMLSEHPPVQFTAVHHTAGSSGWTVKVGDCVELQARYEPDVTSTEGGDLVDVEGVVPLGNIRSCCGSLSGRAASRCPPCSTRMSRAFGALTYPKARRRQSSETHWAAVAAA